MDLSMIIVSYNTGEAIADTIRVLDEASAHLDAEIIVVDNNSADDTVAIATATIDRGQVIATGENLGFGGGVNRGLGVAGGRHTLILNDDAVIDAESLDRLIEVLDSSADIAIVGPAIVDGNAEPMPAWRINFPGLREELTRITKRLPRRRRRGRGDEPFDVAWLVAACVLADTEVLRTLGGFNPEFFLYAEDIDLCRRLRQAGYRSVTVPEATAVHIGGVATSKTYDGDRQRSMLQTKGRAVFYRLWYRRPTRMLIYLSRAIGLRRQPQRAATYLSLMVYDGPTLRGGRFPAPIPGPANAQLTSSPDGVPQKRDLGIHQKRVARNPVQ